MNGLDATKSIKAFLKEKNLQDVPIIGLTAHAGEGYRNQGIEAGMMKVMSKPINLNEFAKMIHHFSEY